MVKIKIGIPSNSIYLNFYKAYFEKLDFDIIESKKSVSDKNVTCLYENIFDLENKCDYIVLPKYKIQNVKTDSNNYLVHNLDNDNSLFCNLIGQIFYIESKTNKKAYDESMIYFINN